MGWSFASATLHAGLGQAVQMNLWGYLHVRVVNLASQTRLTVLVEAGALKCIPSLAVGLDLRRRVSADLNNSDYWKMYTQNQASPQSKNGLPL